MENGDRRVVGDSNCAGRAGLLMAAPFFPVLPTRRRFLSFSLLFLRWFRHRRNSHLLRDNADGRAVATGGGGSGAEGQGAGGAETT